VSPVQVLARDVDVDSAAAMYVRTQLGLDPGTALV
jgi:hypothetical protein